MNKDLKVIIKNVTKQRKMLKTSADKIERQLDQMGIYATKDYEDHVNKNIVFKCTYGNQHNLLIWFSPAGKKLVAEAVDAYILTKYAKANIFKRIWLGIKYIITGAIDHCGCQSMWECTDLESLKELQWSAEQAVDLKQLSTTRKRTKKAKS